MRNTINFKFICFKIHPRTKNKSYARFIQSLVYDFFQEKFYRFPYKLVISLLIPEN